jgi:hypothetical protein
MEEQNLGETETMASQSTQIPQPDESKFIDVEKIVLSDDPLSAEEESSSSTSPTSDHCTNPDENYAFTLLDCFTATGSSTQLSGDMDLCNSWVITGRMDIIGGKVIIHNTNGRIVAVVLREKLGHVILRPRPVYEGQRRHRLLFQDKCLYPLAIVSTKPFSRKLVIHRYDTKVTYELDRCGRLFGTSMVRICEQTSGKICGRIRHYFEDGDVSKSSWDVMAIPGVCPSVMICLVAILNKSMGRMF